MFIGFDYGTSNCAVGVMQQGQPHVVSLGEHGKFIPSTLYAPSRDIIVHWLYQQLSPEQQLTFKRERSLPLQTSQLALRELIADGIEIDLAFGQLALAKYLDEPDEGYYIKSPKSFLGASGLAPMQINLFEDIVAAMMANIKSLAENTLKQDISKAVIGRPINFQGLRGEESNCQAIDILTNAAKRVGFSEVAFQYEPVAAGLEYEAKLTQETRVLVVDIGGGTTDCSMILMSPDYMRQTSREAHLLSHSGVRIGGNDFDIQLALKGIMPSFGLDSMQKSGKPMPANCFNQAVAINNVNEQTEFYSASNRRLLQELIRDAEEPDKLVRLLKAHDRKLSYRLVNGAELAKIGLTTAESQQILLEDIDEKLTVEVSRTLMRQANVRQLYQIGQLIDDAIKEAGTPPDAVFVTGGTAKSPVINQFLREKLPDTPLVVGDHFGSVTVGLARWAERLYA